MLTYIPQIGGIHSLHCGEELICRQQATGHFDDRGRLTDQKPGRFNLKYLLYALLATSFVACANGRPGSFNDFDVLVASGKCYEAEKLANENSHDPGIRFYNLAVVAGRCENNLQKFVDYARLSARYGNVYAGQLLVKAGEPVPSADLRPQQDRVIVAPANSLAGQDQFCAGFSEGYQSIKGDMVIVPICPIAPITPIGSTDFREGIKVGIRAAQR